MKNWDAANDYELQFVTNRIALIFQVDSQTYVILVKFTSYLKTMASHIDNDPLVDFDDESMSHVERVTRATEPAGAFLTFKKDIESGNEARDTTECQQADAEDPLKACAYCTQYVEQLMHFLVNKPYKVPKWTVRRSRETTVDDRARSMPDLSGRGL